MQEEEEASLNETSEKSVGKVETREEKAVEIMMSMTMAMIVYIL